MPDPKLPSQSTGHIHLDKDGERAYVLNPGNDDLFVRTGRQIILDCQLNISIEVWRKELSDMFDHVSQWSREHASQVEACYALPRGAKIVLFFVPTSPGYHFDLGDELTTLDMELARQFNVGVIEVGQIPGHEVARFIDPDTTRRVYGQCA